MEGRFKEGTDETLLGVAALRGGEDRVDLLADTLALSRHDVQSTLQVRAATALLDQESEHLLV